MFLLTWKDNATDEQKRDWESLIGELYSLEVEARDAGDPILFHGTSLDNARSIMADGPRAKIRELVKGGRIEYVNGMYLGTLSSAEAMTGIRAVNDKRPAIIAVRASDLSSSGRLLPDSNIISCGACRAGRTIWPDRPDPNSVPETEAEVMGMDWRGSIEMFGTLAYSGDGPIPGAMLLESSGDPGLERLRGHQESPGP